MTAMLSSRHSQTVRPVRTGLPFYRRLELRRQTGGHPMTLVTTLAVGALAGMMLAPESGSAFASFDPPANVAVGTHTTAKTSRLPRTATVSPAGIRPQATAGANACTPPPAAPARRQPVAYV
ncbi:YtxH domain-containing protein [Ollibium composti]|uniref:Uncharacterized protein n=1 Tax=Ollibium composti TaxID=2675109 RepID=A0ABY2Q6Z4_9HYPH|nr:YtxH domain-containing protein [Mesorhizobium composti]THF57422.1 hypothetical protein E6C48_10425 [Mesorhizobium composti]